MGQNRTLDQLGTSIRLSYVKGINQIKAGVTYEQTFLNENDRLGIVDPTYNAPCITAATVNAVNPYPCRCARTHVRTAPATLASTSRTTPSNPNAPGSAFTLIYNPTLAPYDLTRGGSLLHLQWPHRCEGACPLRPRRDHERKLVSEPRPAWRLLQRSHHCAAGRASRWACLQHQEDQYDSSCFLCANAGISFQ